MHIYTPTDLASPHRTELVISIRSRRDSMACFGKAARSARERLPGAALTDIRSVPAPRATPFLEALCRKHTAFPSLLALLTAAGGYRPSVRLDLTGAEGRALARAYDVWQARWGDPTSILRDGRGLFNLRRRTRHGRCHKPVLRLRA